MGEIIQFKASPHARQPKRQPSPFLAQIMRDTDGWLVLNGRGHGWLHATRTAAIREASELANGFGVGILFNLGRRA